MKHTSILPVQFNTLFDSTEALTGTLKRYSLEIETNLLKVSNCVEMGVKVLAKEGKEKISNTKSSLNNIPNPEEEISRAKKYILDKLEEIRKEGNKLPLSSKPLNALVAEGKGGKR